MSSFQPKGILLDNFIEVSKTKLDRGSLKRHEWIAKNFRHPKDDRLPWSFKDHEFQIDIVNCENREKAVEKCAQVGLSTIQIRDVLAFLATHDFVKGAYVLPTTAFSREFTQSRFDPAVESSEVVSSMISSDADNTSIKRLGTNFLIMRGTSGTTAAISVDLDMLVIDEVDFCNQQVLSSFESRLQHSDMKIRNEFSTPTLPGYGINALYQDSSKGVRMVKHDHCGQWVTLDFFSDVVLPGLGEVPLADFRKDMLHLVDPMTAWYRCPKCGHPIKEENLADPDKREWVHAHPNHYRMGFAVKPWDVPRYNPLHDVLSSIRKYTYGDFCNFRLGITYESAENSFLQSVIERMAVIPGVSMDALLGGAVRGVYIGCDLGKINHIVIGVANRNDGVDIICHGTIDIRKLPENHLGKFLVRLAQRTRCVRMVIDSMPDYAASLYAASMLPGIAFGAQYGGTSATLDIYVWNEDRGIVKIDRDAHFDDLASASNSKKIGYPVEYKAMAGHLSVMKKAKVQTSKGMEEKWTSTSDEDHYAHALGYMWAAFASVESRFRTLKAWAPAVIGTAALRT